MLYMTEREVDKFIEFGGAIDEACDTIQNNAGCESCPGMTNGCGCISGMPPVEAYCIPAHVWLEFFNFADDIDSGLDFEATMNPDRSDWDER